MKEVFSKCDIALSIKRKKQGFGVFHQTEQELSEKKIHNLLYAESEIWHNVREIERKTGLHHTTIKKAIERLKEKEYLLEVNGSNRMRLFTSPISDLAKKIRKNCKNDPKFKKRLLSFNAKPLLRINFSPSFYEKRLSGYQRRIKKKRKLDEYDKINLKARKKRQTISKKNRKNT